MWLYEVDTLGDRKCLTNKFPYDSPGDLDKERVLELNFMKKKLCKVHQSSSARASELELFVL